MQDALSAVPSTVAVIVAVPAARAVIVPLLREIMPAGETFQITDLFVALLGRTVTEIAAV